MLLLLAQLAHADDATCLACCRAGGLGDCPTELHVRTEKSDAEPMIRNWELQGAWVLSCDGSGVFDPTIRVELDHEPGYGEVLGAGKNPLALHCFSQACALPAGVCVGPVGADGQVALVGCDDELPVDQKQLAGPPGRTAGAQARIVVVDGKPLVAEAPSATPPAPSPSPYATPAPAPSPSPYATPAPAPSPSPYATPAPAPSPSPYATPAPAPGPSPYATPAPAPSPSPYATPAPSPSATPAPMALELPADPPDPCAPAPDAMRAESRKRVGTGDDLRMAGRSPDALRDYRAALTMDKCNGYAWVAIAQLANDQGRTDLAIRALRNGTRLLPAHPGAWIMLARAYETFGQRSLAAEAFKKASEVAPGNAEAIEGYMRTR